ncbi:MAG: hypothetical protein AAGD14_13720 [Planctomycetota bacterium]
MADVQGAATPSAPMLPAEQQALRAGLAHPAREFGGVVLGGVLASIGVLILLMIVMGLFVLIAAGVSEFIFDRPLRAPGEATAAQVRTALLGFAVVWPSLFVAYGLRRWLRDRKERHAVDAGAEPLRCLATFRTRGFNTTEEKESFINPGCFGDDLVAQLLQGLEADGEEIDPEPIAEDFGWAGRFRGKHHVIVSFRPDDDEGAGLWYLHVDPATRPGAEAVHRVLARTEGVDGLGWHLEPTA